MKTLHSHIARSFILILSIMFLSLTSFAEELISVSGKVVDKNSKKTLENVTLSVPGSNIATVSNSDGRFTIKIPSEFFDNGLRAFRLGYRSVTVPENALSLNRDDLTIIMEPIGKVLKEVTVQSADPRMIVREALLKIPHNYSDKNNLFTAFYRETVRKGNRFVGISEAMLDVLKRPYKNRHTNGEKVQIDKGRKLLSQKPSDTLAVKLTGGPYMAVFLDAVKNGEHLFSIDELDEFNFKMESPASIDDRNHFAISFKPRLKHDYPQYKGKMFIDMETLAISRVEFELDMSDKDKVTKFILRKKPSGLHFKPQEVSGIATYKLVDGKTYLNYINSIVKFKCDWKKKLFSSGYTTQAEMVMVDRDENPDKNIKFNNSFGQRGVFTDVVDNYWEENFWKDYNIIEPTESLEKAVDKLKKRP